MIQVTYVGDPEGQAPSHTETQGVRFVLNKPVDVDLPPDHPIIEKFRRNPHFQVAGAPPVDLSAEHAEAAARARARVLTADSEFARRASEARAVSEAKGVAIVSDAIARHGDKQLKISAERAQQEAARDERLREQMNASRMVTAPRVAVPPPDMRVQPPVFSAPTVEEPPVVEAPAPAKAPAPAPAPAPKKK